jgi:CheY-like chemotaxis protein
METEKDQLILLVEDDLFVRDLYVRTLKRAGYKLEYAIDGEEGLQKTHELKPDLILLDIMLPKMNGIEMLRTVKTDDTVKDIPIFLLTNLGQDTIIREAFSIGASGYILKARLLPQEVIKIIDRFFETGIVPDDILRV